MNKNVLTERNMRDRKLKKHLNIILVVFIKLGND